MKTFGDNEMTWRGNTDVEHVIVATKGSSWDFLCDAESVVWKPSKPARFEYETVEKDPKLTREPVVWRHDRAKVTCPDCLCALGRLDPGFLPSQVALALPPLTDTMGRAEVEMAAALLVRVCQERGDFWQPVELRAVVEVVKADAEAGRDPVASINRNPFWQPDVHDLVRRGYAEWVGAAGTAPLRFTAKGLDSIRKWVRK